ncbi:MAG: autotransporter subunit C, partial [Pseudomonadota bacterium]|nr:autotransporter subunit C [Pseudomonadota bacterium]
AGDASNSTVNNVFSSVAILMGNNQGGLIGRFNGSTLANSLSTGYVKNGHGLLDYSHDNNNANLYWATDTSGQETSQGSHASYFGALLSELQCPTAPNDASCTDKGTLYENWDSEVWDFGSDRQLPGLIMNGVVYRDSDGDGTLDVNYSPTIELLLTQNGREENTIVEGMGDVTIEVIITDENGWDYHSVEWSSNDINLADSYEFGNSITFSSDGLVAGDYTISTTVTDTGIPQLSDTAEMTIRVISNVDPAPAASSGGGGSGGGAMFWLLALLSAPLLMGRVRA